MSKKYKEAFGEFVISKEEMRQFCQRPGNTDENGKVQYFTEQNHKKECDINEIIKKYDKTGLINHLAKFEGRFGDITGFEFKTMQDKIAGAKSMFEELPAEIRKEFNNTPEDLLKFMEDPKNRDRAIELGIINPNWTEGTDGLGEHVPEGGQKIKPDQEKLVPEKQTDKKTENSQ